MSIVAKLDEDGRLLCPACGGNNLHEGKIATLKNINDCAGSVSSGIIISGESIVKIQSHVKLPFRGDSIVVEFWCESCVQPTYNLFISFHKGNQFLTWEPEFPESPEFLNLL